MSFWDSELFTWGILPVLIFIARICDVSLGTIRIIFVARGRRFLAPLLGFFEIMIWLIAIGKVVQNLDNIGCLVAYAAGFSAGNFAGIWIEDKLAVGTYLVRTITKGDAGELIRALNAGDYGATSMSAEGSTGPVRIIYTIIKRGDLRRVAEIIRNYDEKAFYSIEDVRFVREGIFPLRKSFSERFFLGLGRKWRKGK